MASMNTRLNIKMLVGNIVQNHGVSNKLGSNNLVLVLKQESMEYIMKSVFSLRWNCRELKGIVKLRFFRLVTMILQWLKDSWRTSNLKRRQTRTDWIKHQNGLVDETNVRLFAKCTRSPSSAIRFKKPIDMLGFFGWLASIKQGMLELVKENIDQGAGLQEVQTQDLMDYQLVRDREQHLACELFGYREDNNEAAFAVAAVEKIYAHESLTFNNAVACEVISKWKAGLKDDMDARSDVYVLSNGCRKCSDDDDGYYWGYTPGMFIHLFLYIDDMVFSYGCKAEIWATKGLLDKAKRNVLGMEIIGDQSGYTPMVSQSSQEYQMVCTILDIASADVGSLKANLQHMEDLSTTEAGYVTFTEAWKKKIWLKGLLTESIYELRLVGIATGALVKDGSRSEVSAQVEVAAYRY
nr:zinc finger, CCHC-type [Tanacetum cinerariifolium]